jgi:hypothetical protein
MIAKPTSIKGTGGKSGGCAWKAIELTSGDLLHVAEVSQVSEVRAVCSNPARTDLCGGRGVNSRPYRDCGRGEQVTAPPIPIVHPASFRDPTNLW